MKFMFFFIKLVILPSHEKHPGQKKESSYFLQKSESDRLQFTFALFFMSGVCRFLIVYAFYSCLINK